jgi:hypothetical protein
MAGPDAVFIAPSAHLAARHVVPAIYNSCDWVVSGGLMSYGTSPLDAHRQAGVYAGLHPKKSTKPAELCRDCRPEGGFVARRSGLARGHR